EKRGGNNDDITGAKKFRRNLIVVKVVHKGPYNPLFDQIVSRRNFPFLQQQLAFSNLYGSVCCPDFVKLLLRQQGMLINVFQWFCHNCGFIVYIYTLTKKIFDKEITTIENRFNLYSCHFSM